MKKYIQKTYHNYVRFSGNRELVLERDGNRCVKCGAADGLNVHHRNSSSPETKKNDYPDNLVTLCKACHVNEHRKTVHRKRYLPRIEVSCKQCGKKFIETETRIADGRGRYCSKGCQNKSQEAQVQFTCLQCGKDFSVVPSRAKKGKVKYCSLECRKAAGYDWTQRAKG